VIVPFRVVNPAQRLPRSPHPSFGGQRPASSPSGPTKGESFTALPAQLQSRLWRPSVTVIVPVRDVVGEIDACLWSIEAQSYPSIIEVLVVDGCSSDGTAQRAAAHPGVTVLANPRRSRPAALNVGLAAARGEVVVRVDARTRIEADYVARCVEALQRSGAFVVGGPMRLSAGSARERGIAAAMASRLGGGTAAFRRDHGVPRFTDTVYLGAYRRTAVLELGGYDEDFGGNEDAELNHRARRAGGVYLDPSIRSSYRVRPSLAELFVQYRRYGRARAGTLRKHPGSLSARQLAIPAFLAGLLSPHRRVLLAAYASGLLLRTAVEASSDPLAAPMFAAAVPTMHVAWAVGLLEGLAPSPRRPRSAERRAAPADDQPAGRFVLGIVEDRSVSEHPASGRRRVVKARREWPNDAGGG